MRLDRFLSTQTAYSRKEVQGAIRKGLVSVNGVCVHKPDFALQPEHDAVLFAGRPILYQAYHYFLLHKPEGVITATEDATQRTVLDLLRPEDRLPKLAPCGRLDLDTTGLLLITDDGHLAHQMLSPKHHVEKYYLAQLRDPLSPEAPVAFEQGIALRAGNHIEFCQPAHCMEIAPRQAVVALHEGKYHQVKRMFSSMGNHVEHLLRFRIGNLTLPPNLACGDYFVISNKDVAQMLINPTFLEVCAHCAANYSSYWINKTL